MNRRIVETLRRQLLTERASLVAVARRTIEEDAPYDTSELADEIDQASTEYDHSMVLRLRDREKYYLNKIDRALDKMDNGEFGICEDCGETISPRRLEVRPVTTLCIGCKEVQEVHERSWG